ncbi:MAG: hypothetical protein KA319_11185 [Ferruginibacter sp.]|nr:hypothetical protein [Ferruginibacter sp.]
MQKGKQILLAFWGLLTSKLNVQFFVFNNKGAKTILFSNNYSLFTTHYKTALGELLVPNNSSDRSVISDYNKKENSLSINFIAIQAIEKSTQELASLKADYHNLASRLKNQKH